MIPPPYALFRFPSIGNPWFWTEKDSELFLQTISGYLFSEMAWLLRWEGP